MLVADLESWFIVGVEVGVSLCVAGLACSERGLCCCCW